MAYLLAGGILKYLLAFCLPNLYTMSLDQLL